MVLGEERTGTATILIDEPVLGLEPFLQDLGWKTIAVQPGLPDDEVVRLARTNGYVVVTPDRRLLARCRASGIRVVDVGFEGMARRVHEALVGRETTK